MCFRALKWLKAGNSLVAERALSHIQLQVKEMSSTKSAKFSDMFRDKATIKGLIIVLILYIAQQFSGIFAMVIIDDLQIAHELAFFNYSHILMF